MIEIDGSRGEGGGQMLRSALALSAITGTPMRITNIRARRAKPGLMAQHLSAVQATAAVCGARVDGARQRSQTLVFEPQGIRAGAFHFDIGTAGSTALVLQTVLLPLSYAAAPSVVTVTGGTHVPWSPCFDYLQLHWARYLREIGVALELALERAGFYPRGGGQVRAAVHPADGLQALRITERGALRRIRGVSGVANLDDRIAERQRRQALRRLAGRCTKVDIDIARLPARGQGTVVVLLAELERSQCCYTSLGARGKPAERVADEAVDGLEAFLAGDGAIDEYLADQLVVPLACATGTSELRSARVTQHLLTNVEVVRLFIDRPITVEGALGASGVLRIGERHPTAPRVLPGTADRC
jgi:RNA 3'-terminal phosphate cyclase (ATP)